MLIPDVNLLVYAYNTDAPFHEKAKEWWEQCMNGRERIGIPWIVLLGFLRLTTSRAILLRPFAPSDSIAIIRAWLQCPPAQLIAPGPRHLAILEELATAIGTAGRMTTDLHLAALAIELNATLCSNDTDFTRLSGLRLRNPIS